MNVAIAILITYAVTGSAISPKRKKPTRNDFSLAQPVVEPTTSETKNIASSSKLENAHNFSKIQPALGKNKTLSGAIITVPKPSLSRSTSYTRNDVKVKSGPIPTTPDYRRKDEPPTTQTTSRSEILRREPMRSDTSSSEAQGKMGKCLSLRHLPWGEKNSADPKTLKDKPLRIANRSRSSRKKSSREKSTTSDETSTSSATRVSPPESSSISRFLSLTRILSLGSPRRSSDESSDLSSSRESNIQLDSVRNSSRKKSIFHKGLKKKLDSHSSSLNENVRGFSFTIIDEYRLYVQPKDAKDEEKYLAKYFWNHYECVLQCVQEENFSLKLRKRGLNDMKLCELIAEQPEMTNKLILRKHGADEKKVNSKSKKSKASTSSDIPRKNEGDSNKNIHILSSSRADIMLKDYSPIFEETDLGRKIFKFSPTTFSDVISCNHAQNDYFFISQGVGPNSFFISTSNSLVSSEPVTLIAHFTFGRDSDGHLVRLPIDEEPYAAVAHNKLRYNQRLWSLERYHYPKPAPLEFPIPSWEYGFLHDGHPYLEPRYLEVPEKKEVSVRRLVIDVPLFSYAGKFTEEVENNLVQYYMRHRDFIVKCEIDEPMYLKDRHFYGRASNVCKMIAGDKKICDVLEINHSLRKIKMIDWATRKIFPYQYKQYEYVNSSVTDAIKCYYSFMISSWNKNSKKMQTVKVEDWFFVSNGVGRDSYFIFTEDGVDGPFLFRGHVTFKRDRRGDPIHLSEEEEKYSYMRAWEDDSGKWDWAVSNGR